MFNQQDLIKQTEGIECKKDLSIIEEIPEAYNPIEDIIANQLDLVSVENTLKQVLCVKG